MLASNSVLTSASFEKSSIAFGLDVSSARRFNGSDNGA
jgi:hypothetical protein